MRLLILTQVVDQNDPMLGFFHAWIEECARQCEHVYVVCLREGQHSFSSNVSVLSLGKEQKQSRIQYLRRFFSYIWKYRNDYDAVFVHMNQIYVVLGAPFWRLWGKRIVFWYEHGHVSLTLRIAERLTSVVVTASEGGFRLQSAKKRVVGHGIDTKQFVQCVDTYQPTYIRILYVGRIAPVKQCEVLIEAAAVLRERGEQCSVTFVGDTHASGTNAYYLSLQEQIRRLGVGERIRFVGGVSHHDVLSYVCIADIFVNPSVTGSLDKAGLEAMAAGVPVVTCNEAFRDVFGIYADRLMFPHGDAHALADRIVSLQRAPDRTQIVDTLRVLVVQKHSLETLIPRILALLQKGINHT